MKSHDYRTAAMWPDTSWRLILFRRPLISHEPVCAFSFPIICLVQGQNDPGLLKTRRKDAENKNEKANAEKDAA